MKRTKKLIAIITLSMMVGNQALALAEIPSGTAIIGDKAYDLEYLNNKANEKEIKEQLEKNGCNIKVKTFNGKWIDNLTGNEIKNRDIPRVWYKNQEGKMAEYFAYDGEEVEFGINYVYVNRMDEIKIRILCGIGNKEEISKSNFKINGKELGEKDTVYISEDNKEITIKLNEPIKNQSYELALEINNIKGINNEALAENYKTKIMVVKASKDVPKGEYNGQVSLLLDNTKVDGLTVSGDMYVGGKNISLNKVSVGEGLIVLPQASGTLSVRDSQYNNVFIAKGAKLGEIELDNPTAVVSEHKESFKNLIISGTKKEVVLAGLFSKVTINSPKEIKLIPNTEIDLLVVNKDVSIQGDSSVKIKEIQREKGVKVEAKKQDDSVVLPPVKDVVKDPPIGGGGIIVPVPDTTKPVITLKGQPTVDLFVGDSYSDEGATASDDRDGDISNKIKTTIKNSKGETIEAVDTGKVDTYTITYDVSDAAGNWASIVTRKVIVKEKPVEPDTTKPVITLKGQPTVELFVGDSYSDEGATASDDRDGDISNKIKTTIKNSKGETIEAVDTSKVDTYTITYEVADAAGNKAEVVTRKVIVKEKPVEPDTTKPVITLKGQPTVELFVGDSYSDEGATASDDRDGDITNRIATTIKNSKGETVATVDTSKVDTYTITYDASDLAGNKADTVTRRVIVEDRLPVASNVEITGTLRVDNQLFGAYEYSDEDGDLEGTPIYRWYRADNIQGTNLQLIEGETYNRYLLTPQDAGKYIFFEVVPVSVDGTQGTPVRSEVAGPIVSNAAHKVNVDVDGYNVRVVLKGDDLKKEITVKIIDNGTGSVEFVGQGQPKDGRIEFNTRIERAGTFTLEYNAFTNEPNGIHTLNITGEGEGENDTVKPIITLYGGESIELNVGETFTEPGFEANDNKDGNINHKVTLEIKDAQGRKVEAVDTSKAGEYTIHYSVRDAHGNKAIEKARKVKIKDKQADSRITITTENRIATIVVEGNNMNKVVTMQVINKATGDQAFVDQKDSINNRVSFTTGILSPGTYEVRVKAFGDIISLKEFAVEGDVIKPVIKLKGESTIELFVGDRYIEPGYTAIDDKDGDITNIVTTTVKNSRGESIPLVDTSKADTYTITYAVADQEGNKAEVVTRSVVVRERKPAVTNVAVTGESREGKKLTASYTYFQGNNELEGTSIYKWYRADDGQGTNLQLIGGATTKEYTLTSADVGKIIFFEVTPVSASGIVGEAVRSQGLGPVVSTNQGKVAVEVDGFNVRIVLTGDNLKKDVTVKIINNQTGGIELTDQGTPSNGSVEFRTRIEKIGTFTVEYNAFKGESNGSYQFTILGEGEQDTVKPVIELVGQKSMTIPVGGTYTDPGFKATDNKDGDVTNNVQVAIKDKNGKIVASIDTAIAGRYTIHYNVSDNAGNTAVEQVRTVLVQENIGVNDPRITVVVNNNRAEITVTGENMNSIVAWRIVNVATGVIVCVDQGLSNNNVYTAMSAVLSQGTYRVEMNAFKGEIIAKEFVVE